MREWDGPDGGPRQDDLIVAPDDARPDAFMLSAFQGGPNIEALSRACALDLACGFASVRGVDAWTLERRGWMLLARHRR